MTTLEFTAGRMLCRPIRDFLNAEKFKGVPIEWLEGTGWIERRWIVKGPQADLERICGLIERYFKETP